MKNNRAKFYICYCGDGTFYKNKVRAEKMALRLSRLYQGEFKVLTPEEYENW